MATPVTTWHGSGLSALTWGYNSVRTGFYLPTLKPIGAESMMMLHLTSVLQWEDSCKQVFGFPFKCIVAQGFWEPSNAAITGDNFRRISLSFVDQGISLTPPSSPNSPCNSKHKTLMKRKDSELK